MATSLSKFKDAELRKRYRAENSRGCEVWRWLAEVDRAIARKAGAEFGLELHHILRQPHYQYDCKSNFIMIGSRVHHAFGHDGHIFELTAVSLYAKFKKGEFDIAELNQAARRPTIRNELYWIKNHLPHRPEYVAMCDEMLNTLPEE